MNLPNKITLTRIFMIPLFLVVFYLDVFHGYHYEFLIAAIVFAVAASTDFLDGHIARSRNLVTNLGKFLDPIADKVLVSTAFILLLSRSFLFEIGIFAGWGAIFAGICVSIILARELIVSGFRMIAAERKIVLAADFFGKIKTTLQDVAIVLILVGAAFLGHKAGEIVGSAGMAVLFLSTIATVFSGVNYIVRNRQVFREDEKKEETGGDGAENAK